jgi:hypothetical protein
VKRTGTKCKRKKKEGQYAEGQYAEGRGQKDRAEKDLNYSTGCRRTWTDGKMALEDWDREERVQKDRDVREKKEEDRRKVL